VAVDDGSAFDFLMVSHSVTVAILWHRLEGVENRALSSVRRELSDTGRFDPALSENLSEWYICALVLSEPIQQWLSANKRSMKEHVYPEDVRSIPIKHIASREQEHFVRLERERHRIWRQLIELEEQGFRAVIQADAPVHTLAGRFRREHPEFEHLLLFQIPQSVLEVAEPFYHRDLHRVRALGGELRVGREVFARVGDAISRKADVARFLARYFAEMPGTLADRQSVDALPRTEEGLLALARYVEEQEEGIRRRQARIAEIQAEIDRRAWELYRPETPNPDTRTPRSSKTARTSG
jgi:hypothetical protein